MQVSRVSVAELESVALEQAVFGPFLGIGEADINLSEESIRQGGEDLVLRLVNICIIVPFSSVLWTDQISEQAVQTMIVTFSHVHHRLPVRRERAERIVLQRKTLSRSEEVLMRGLWMVQVTF